MSAVAQFTQLFEIIGQSNEGRALILQSGGKELFGELFKSLPPSEIQILGLIEKLIQSLILGETMPGRGNVTEPDILDD